MSKRFLAAVGAALTLALLAGCGGGGGGGTGGNGGGGGSVTPEQRVAALHAVTVYYNTLPHADPASDNQKLADYLKTRAEFEASGVGDDNCVWARFTDGRMFVFANSRVAPTAQLSTASRTPTARGRSALPTSQKCYALHAMGQGWGNATADIATWFADKGYDVTYATGTVAMLREDVKQAGALYIDSHGGKCLNRTGQRVYAVGTSDPVTPEGEVANKADLDAGHLVYLAAPWGLGPNREPLSDTHYAFTRDFVSTYIDVVPNSLVYIDACYSFDRGMIAAFGDKGATTYLGWDDKVADGDAIAAASYFFDRALGTNIVDPVQDPPQRTFDTQTVYNALRARGLGQSIGELQYTSLDGPTGVDLFAPTITRLAPREEEDTLYIAGAFGSDPGSDGKVTIGGVVAHVKTWTKDAINCALPVSGPGSAGNVVVEVRGHRSNVVQLTDWRPVFTITFHNLGTMQYKVTFTLHIRCDVHSYRLLPDETPRQGEWPFTFAKDSTATIAVDGEYTEPQTGTRITWQRNGSADVPLNGPDTRTIYGGGTIATSAAAGATVMNTELEVVVADAIKTTMILPDGTTTTSLDEIRASTASFSQDMRSTYPVRLNDLYQISAGKSTVGSQELGWSDAAASYPPDRVAARSVVLKPSRPTTTRRGRAHGGR